MAFETYLRTFTSEYSELEVYADELMRSNPRSKVVVEKVISFNLFINLFSLWQSFI